MDAAWLRSAIGVANAATQGLGLHEPVTVEKHNGQDALGTRQPYFNPVTYQAMVSRTEGLLPTDGGTEIKYKAIVAFVAPVDVDVRDRVRLSDGLTGPLYIPQGGLQDPATGKPFARTVYLRR